MSERLIKKQMKHVSKELGLPYKNKKHSAWMNKLSEQMLVQCSLQDVVNYQFDLLNECIDKLFHHGENRIHLYDNRLANTSLTQERWRECADNTKNVIQQFADTYKELFAEDGIHLDSDIFISSKYEKVSDKMGQCVPDLCLTLNNPGNKRSIQILPK